MAAFLGAGFAFAGVPEFAVALTPESARGDMEQTLQRQVTSVLAGFDEISQAMADRNEPPTAERIVALRSSIEALRKLAASYVAAPTTLSRNTAKSQQASSPSGPVKTSPEPPSPDELAAMERATEQTHLPGPPLKKVGEEKTAVPLLTRVEEACAESLAWLDKVELALESRQECDVAWAAHCLGHAREVIEKLAVTFP